MILQAATAPAARTLAWVVHNAWHVVDGQTQSTVLTPILGQALRVLLCARPTAGGGKILGSTDLHFLLEKYVLLIAILLFLFLFLVLVLFLFLALLALVLLCLCGEVSLVFLVCV